MKTAALIALTLVLGACSGGDAPQAPAPASGTVSEGNVFKADVDALAKAKETEKLILDAAEQQREQIDSGQ